MRRCAERQFTPARRPRDATCPATDCRPGPSGPALARADAAPARGGRPGPGRPPRRPAPRLASAGADCRGREQHVAARPGSAAESGGADRMVPGQSLLPLRRWRQHLHRRFLHAGQLQSQQLRHAEPGTEEGDRPDRPGAERPTDPGLAGQGVWTGLAVVAPPPMIVARTGLPRASWRRFGPVCVALVPKLLLQPSTLIAQLSFPEPLFRNAPSALVPKQEFGNEGEGLERGFGNEGHAIMRPRRSKPGPRHRPMRRRRTPSQPSRSRGQRSETPSRLAQCAAARRSDVQPNLARARAGFRAVTTARTDDYADPRGRHALAGAVELHVHFSSGRMTLMRRRARLWTCSSSWGLACLSARSTRRSRRSRPSTSLSMRATQLSRFGAAAAVPAVAC